MAALGWDGSPLSCHLMLSAGPRAALGLFKPGNRQINGATRSRWPSGSGAHSIAERDFDVEDAADYTPGIADYVERLVAPYFEAIAAWYGALRVGQVAGELHAIIERHLGDPFFGIFLNPGHLIGLDEWIHSPIAPGSRVGLPVPDGVPGRRHPGHRDAGDTTNIEGGVALADATLRADLETVIRRCRPGSRHGERMDEALGIELHPDVLPFSNIPAWLPPFLLGSERAMTLAG